MKANQLLLAAILASAIAAPIVTLAEDKRVVQQMTPAAVRLPIEGELPSLVSITSICRARRRSCGKSFGIRKSLRID